MSRKFVWFVAIAWFAGCNRMEPQEAVITIDPSQRYQEMVAWEATAQAGQDFHSFTEYKDKLISDSINELGINRMRLEARSGIENSADSFGQLRSGAIGNSQFRERRYEIINDNDDPFS